jgi:phage baseplate assembly protein W
MGSLIVKLDAPTEQRLQKRYHYSDIDVLGLRMPRQVSDPDNPSSLGVEAYDVPMSYDVEAVKLSIRNILMWRVGESILRPEFGHKLQLSMYQQMNEFNQDQVCEEIKRAIQTNEPRVEVDGVAVKKDEDPDSNALYVKVIYHVVGQGSDGAKLTHESIISGK